MDGIVTLNELINISDYIKSASSTNEEYNELIDEKICDQYDITDIKNKLVELINKFKSARYLYEFPIGESIKVTPTYERDESFHQRNNVSQVEKAIERKVDKQLLMTDIYNSIIKVSYKLSNSEVIYLINTFLTHKSEESISEILGISKTYLQKIKKSCLVKMWTDLQQYCETDD